MFLPGLLTYYGVLNLSSQAVRSFAIAGLLGASLSGFIMTSVIEGRPGVSRLLRRIVRWRVGLQLCLLTLICRCPAVMVLATVVRPGALESLDLFRPTVPRGLPASLHLHGSDWRATLRRTGMDRLCAASLAAAVRFAGRGPRSWQSLGTVAPARILNSIPEPENDIPPRGTVLEFVVFAFALWVCV